MFEPHVEQVCVLPFNLAIPLNIVKQHLFRTLFQHEVGEMFIDETPTHEQVQDLNFAEWIVIKEE